MFHLGLNSPVDFLSSEWAHRWFTWQFMAQVIADVDVSESLGNYSYTTYYALSDSWTEAFFR